MQLSYWENERFFRHVDVCIIGSGIVGLSAAIHLRRTDPSLKVLVLERGMLPYGASTRNAGFACFGSVTELAEDLRLMGESEMLKLVEKRWLGLQHLRALLGDEALSWECHGGYELFDSVPAYAEAQDKLHLFNKLLKGIVGENVYCGADERIAHFGFKGIKGMLFNRFEGQIDTGKMLAALWQLAVKEGVLVLNGASVETLEEGHVGLRENISFRPRKILVATNGFAQQLLPELEVKPARAQVLITQAIEGLRLKGTFHYDQGYYYFRNVGDRILLGGGRNLDFEGETSTEMIQTPLIQQKLEQLLRDTIAPYACPEIEMRWSGIMGVGSIRKPLIRQVKNNMYCAVRLGGMGVAIGTLVGREAADLMLSE